VTFVESQHPRIPGHHHGGGEFTKKGVGALPSDPGQTVSRFAHPSTGAAMGKTEIGDTYEELFRQKGSHLLEAHFGHPYVEISGAGNRSLGKTTARNTPLDFRLDHRYGGELKTLNMHAKNQRIAMKTEEVLRKKGEVAKNGWMPLIVVQVVDQATGTVHVYVNEGFSSKKVKTMRHIGSYTYTQKDFRQAQQRKGHWDKRHTRAVAV
jgi:hypothetical protein